jgi:hypothetical protein
MQRQFPTFEDADFAQPLPDGVVNSFLNGVSGHEAKNLVAILFYSASDSAHSPAEITRALIEEQGAPAVWTPKSTSVKNYCSGSLSQVAELVVPEDGAQKRWQANPLHAAGRLSLAGFSTYWGLQFPNISLQDIYGEARSGRGQKYPAELRHKLCETIFTVEGGLSIFRLGELFPEEKYDRITNHVSQLVRSGIIEKTTVYGENPEVLINETEFNSNAFHRQFDHLRPETQALYRTIKDMQRGTILTLKELLDKAREIDPAIDTPLLRSRVLKALVFDDTGYPGLRPATKTRLSNDELTNLTIAPGAADAMVSLYKGVNDIRQGVGLKDYIEMAKSVLGSENQDFRTLIEKNRRFSSGANRISQAETHDQIISILGANGACRLEDLYAALEERIEPGTIRRLVNQLIDLNKVRATPVARGEHFKASRLEYSLVTESEDQLAE